MVNSEHTKQSNRNHGAQGRIGYAVAVIARHALTARVPHREQSQAAATLLASLGDELAVATSKSHSRAVVAAAGGNASSIKLGIDVEWMSPDRPFTAILQTFAPTLLGPLDGDSFYRGWTFLEAYYKAFQELPCSRDIEQIAAIGDQQTPQQIDNGSWVQHQNVFEAFKLCLVWKSSDLCVVEYRSRRPMIDTTDRQT